MTSSTSRRLPSAPGSKPAFDGIDLDLDLGTRLDAGKACGLVESVKTGSDLHAPLDGEVVAINEALQGNPEYINDKPYASWIFKYRPSNAADAAKLLDAKGYETLLGRL